LKLTSSAEPLENDARFRGPRRGDSHAFVLLGRWLCLGVALGCAGLVWLGRAEFIALSLNLVATATTAAIILAERRARRVEAALLEVSHANLEVEAARRSAARIAALRGKLETGVT